MAFELFTRVALRDDFPNHKLRRGDVAMIVEHHPVTNGEDGYSLEVFNAVGETVAVFVVSESQIEPLMRNEVLHIRVLDAAV
ncbi:DUF4926 domain-containing protein [Gloeocapsopsis sp. IPPAS B-1203]|uniref:DUF4926 domain-containing protein n=1 Tax=Gloeocapsopsis sp. IPPAS B-1203 TaxID=2049454 RepID=UPI000C1A17AA|nr:DUF4926 domain-containing protein [Gloeocapsopsis sp. IPPAS B-1203]PIG93539.1 DUF4926 domain-containing protein [Gloeocapsopsis sp. IPPAS B-1203]